MAERLSNQWTETAEEAFGETGVVGTLGELTAKTILESCLFDIYKQHITVEHHPSDKQMQCCGKDLSFVVGGTTYYVDVKNNLHANKDVCIDWPKLRRSKADIWLHINRNDSTDWVIYYVDKMRAHLETKQWRNLYWLTRAEVEAV